MIDKGISVGGHFVIRVYRDNVLHSRHRLKNGVTNVGLDDLLDAAFSGGTQRTNWYVGLINGATSPTLSASDTMSTHNGWTEVTDYDESSRQVWSPVNIATGKIANTSYPAFTANGSATVAGAFITSSGTKGGTSGILWATALFSNGTIALTSGDVIKVYYELNATAS